VYEAFSWTTVSLWRHSRFGNDGSEHRAVGNLRRDPFAMTPSVATTWRLFRALVRDGDRLGSKARAIFYVNWFRKSPEAGVVAGFGENSRVLKWMCERLDGKVEGRETPIGLLPYEVTSIWPGLPGNRSILRNCLPCMRTSGGRSADIERFFARFNDRLPSACDSSSARCSRAWANTRAANRSGGVPRLPAREHEPAP